MSSPGYRRKCFGVVNYVLTLQSFYAYSRKFKVLFTPKTRQSKVKYLNLQSTPRTNASQVSVPVFIPSRRRDALKIFSMLSTVRPFFSATFICASISHQCMFICYALKKLDCMYEHRSRPSVPIFKPCAGFTTLKSSSTAAFDDDPKPAVC